MEQKGEMSQFLEKFCESILQKKNTFQEVLGRKYFLFMKFQNILFRY
jgi:hypothetical protein